jgi:putative FmdB family regulatory protein
VKRLAIYEYRCDHHGLFDVVRPLGTAPESAACAECGSEAKRVFSAPALFRGSRAVVAAIDHAEKSRHEPEVVTSIPSAGARRRTPMAKMTPKLQRLPRP